MFGIGTMPIVGALVLAMQQEADRLDATRYRWLRQQAIGMGMKDAPTWFTGAALDRAIDYEMQRIDA